MVPLRLRVAVLLALGAFASAALAGAGWQVVPSQDVPGSDFDELDGAAVVGAGEAWAVGFSRLSGSTLFRALVEHWNGTSWGIVPSAKISASHDTRLHALAASGPSDVWAVGTNIASADYVSHGLVEHWDGSAWKRMSRASGEPAAATLVSVSADSASEAWAVGWFVTDASQIQPLIERWNGTGWSVVDGAFGGQSYYDRLRAVAALAPDDVWALGTTGRHPTPVIEHWDGSSWSLVPVPPSGYDSVLYAVAAVAPDDIWAVGGAQVTDTLVEHWDGSSWSIVPSPNVPGTQTRSFLTGVVALGAGNVWAVGGAATSSTTRTLVEHWNGTSWTIVSSPPSGTDAELLGASGRRGGPLFAVGWQVGEQRTLILQH
jgi:hypothetical protein